jgi:endonuclease/exonuclease/phosphatase family metal-dependent hydrolase
MLTLLTLNTANYDDHPDWLDRNGFIANAILDCRADVVCLSEIRYTQRNAFNSYAPTYWSLNGITAPTEPANMADHICAHLQKSNPHWTLQTAVAMQYNGSQQWEGLSILTTLQSTDPGSFTIPNGTDGNTRIVQYLTVTVPGGNNITIYNTHYPLDAAARLQDSQNIISTRQQPDTGFFALVGDMNATPTESSMTTLSQAGYVDVQAKLNPGMNSYTFPSEGPNERIDYIWASAPLASKAQSITFVPRNTQVQGGTVYLSDHLGLCAQFSL